MTALASEPPCAPAATPAWTARTTRTWSADARPAERLQMDVAMPRSSAFVSSARAGSRGRGVSPRVLRCVRRRRWILRWQRCSGGDAAWLERVRRLGHSGRRPLWVPQPEARELGRDQLRRPTGRLLRGAHRPTGRRTRSPPVADSSPVARRWRPRRDPRWKTSKHPGRCASFTAHEDLYVNSAP